MKFDENRSRLWLLIRHCKQLRLSGDHSLTTMVSGRGKKPLTVQAGSHSAWLDLRSIYSRIVGIYVNRFTQSREGKRHCVTSADIVFLLILITNILLAGPTLFLCRLQRQVRLQHHSTMFAKKYKIEDISSSLFLYSPQRDFIIHIQFIQKIYFLSYFMDLYIGKFKAD